MVTTRTHLEINLQISHPQTLNTLTLMLPQTGGFRTSFIGTRWARLSLPPALRAEWLSPMFSKMLALAAGSGMNSSSGTPREEVIKLFTLCTKQKSRAAFKSRLPRQHLNGYWNGTLFASFMPKLKAQDFPKASIGQ